MSLFDRLVDEALGNVDELAPLRMVVEKELLHHDIMLALSSAGLLAKLTFIGGTCLRSCYGSSRLSEDLDFTGGADFSREQLKDLAYVLVETLLGKYGLEVTVSEPCKETGNVDTWKLKIQTRPQRSGMPAQRINIDVCAIPSYLPQPAMLLNPYGVDMGTNGLILNVQAREEIYVDKVVAFALRANRIKNRDLWDLLWLRQQGVAAKWLLLKHKLADHRCTPDEFLAAFDERTALLTRDEVAADFRQEMKRFLPIRLVQGTVNEPAFWSVLVRHLHELNDQVQKTLAAPQSEPGFAM